MCVLRTYLGSREKAGLDWYFSTSNMLSIVCRGQFSLLSKHIRVWLHLQTPNVLLTLNVKHSSSIFVMIQEDISLLCLWFFKFYFPVSFSFLFKPRLHRKNSHSSFFVRWSSLPFLTGVSIGVIAFLQLFSLWVLSSFVLLPKPLLFHFRGWLQVSCDCCTPLLRFRTCSCAYMSAFSVWCASSFTALFVPVWKMDQIII